MRISEKHIREGEEIPRFYGVAFHDFVRHEYVCYPIPLNKIVAWIQWLRWKLKSPGLRLFEMGKAHALGYTRGYDIGFKRGWDSFAEEAIRRLDEEGI